MAGVMQIDATNAAKYTDFIALCPFPIATGSTVEQMGRERENWGKLHAPRHTHSSKPLEPNGMTPMRRLEPSHPSPVIRRVLLAILAALALVTADLPGTAGRAAERPPVAGRNGGISAGHPLTAAAGFEVLLRGGNAFDAGVASLLVGGVVEQDFYSLGGEGLVLVYPRSTGKVVAVVGQGWAPKGAT